MPLPNNLKKGGFLKIGEGAVGGKAEGLKRLAALLSDNPDLRSKFNSIDVIIPDTTVLATDAFDAFISANGLHPDSFQGLSDEKIAATCLAATLPQWVVSNLRSCLEKMESPLAVRSSSLLEDARFRAYAGLYQTYMLPNNHPDPEKRLAHLIQAVKLIYASIFFAAPKSFAARVGQNSAPEKMAIIIQQVVGSRYGDYFYPAISGVAQSYNYYPFPPMRPDDGIAIIAMGLGSIVVEGERALRFCPRYPQAVPQRASVEDLLKNAQRFFYCIDMRQPYQPLTINDKRLLARREVTDASAESPMRLLASTFVPEENRIRDTYHRQGIKVLTFANILKFGHFPLAQILSDALRIGKKEMDCPVELEFAINLKSTCHEKETQFAFLQLRPMSARVDQAAIHISKQELAKAFCRSSQALGNAFKQDMHDIIYVRPDCFEAKKTFKIAQEIKIFNAKLAAKGRKYILIGPGRWGSKDHWLGIPVAWQDISEVGAMVETYSPKIPSEPSQGSHFFHNISTIGINYITIGAGEADYLDWDWLRSQSASRTGSYITQITFHKPITVKVDGRSFQGVIYL